MKGRISEMVTGRETGRVAGGDREGRRDSGRERFRPLNALTFTFQTRFHIS